MGIIESMNQDAARLYEARKKFVQAFVRANLLNSRAIAQNAKLTFNFTDSSIDLLDPPHRYSNGAYVATLPNMVNMRQPHLWPKIRLMADAAAAWIKQDADHQVFQSNTYEDRNLDIFFANRRLSLSGKSLLLQSLEKARRESLMFADLEGARQNFIHHFSLNTKRDRYWSYENLRDKIMAEGFYYAALSSFMPDFAGQRRDLHAISSIWRLRLEKETGISFARLKDVRHDAEDYIQTARNMIDRFHGNLNHSLRPHGRQSLYSMGFPVSSKQEKRAWVGKTLIELHEQLVTGHLAERRSAQNFASVKRTKRAKRRDQQKAYHNPSQHEATETPAPKTPSWFKRPKGFEEQSDPQKDAQDFIKTLTPEMQALFGVWDAEESGNQEFPEGKEPVWIELSDLFEDAVEGTRRKKPQNFDLPMDVNWRRDNYIASYKKLRAEHEEIVSVSDLFPDKDDLEKKWLALQKEQPALVQTSRALSRKFETWLRARSGTRPQFESEEGLLDLSRLVNLITDPNTANLYIGEQAALQKDTAVTLLFDFSASMRGNEIQTAMMMAHGISGALERSRIESEILGYTTGNKGALHIVVKDFKQRLRQCAANFGIAVDGNHMGSTNDTDALLWGASRLLARPEKRKIMVIMSDMYPNASFIHQDYPDMDYKGLLKSVAIHLQEMKGIEIAGIGIGPSLATKYYANGVNIQGMKDLGPSLVGQLRALLDPNQAPRMQRRLQAPQADII